MGWLHRCAWGLCLTVLIGCQSPMQDPGMKRLEVDFQELSSGRVLDASAQAPASRQPAGAEPIATSVRFGDPIALVSAVGLDGDEPRPEPKANLTIPPGLPGSDLSPPRLPRDRMELEGAVKKLYPPLPPLERDLVLAPGPEGRPLTLADLQRLASEYSPSIRAAEAAIVAAQGALQQSMAYPNPNFSYEHDTQSTGTAGYPGFGVDQLIKTSNKLELQGAAARMDLFNAQLALRRARLEVAYQVRIGYFNVLVAQENAKVSRALAQFADEIFITQVKLLQGNQAAAYEPMQLRPLALQARFNLIQAINQYQASWRQLTANMGLKDMPPAEVAGRIDRPVPHFDYDQIRNRMLELHTDILTAKNNVYKAEFIHRLAKVQPVPDVDLHLLVQKDYSSVPFYTVYSLTATVPIPMWDPGMKFRTRYGSTRPSTTVTEAATRRSLSAIWSRLSKRWRDTSRPTSPHLGCNGPQSPTSPI
jgi:cobalt-zinc-cadmium efflux system outer membrane protein